MFQNSKDPFLIIYELFYKIREYYVKFYQYKFSKRNISF